MNNKLCNFYRIDNFKGQPPFLALTKMTIESLLQQIQKTKQYKSFQLFFQSKLVEQTQIHMTLEQVATKQETKGTSIIFYICEFGEEEGDDAYYEKIAQLMQLEGEEEKSHWEGANGHILFEGRNHSLLASSIDQTSCRLRKKVSSEDLKLRMARGEQEVRGREIGLIDDAISQLKRLKKNDIEKRRNQLRVERKYSNFDANFVVSLEQTYLSYMLRSGFKLHYVDYREWQFGVIKRKLVGKQRIGLIGDFGTGLADSFQLLDNMVMVDGVNVIIHLGDVYYAGTPEQYETNITKRLNQLRLATSRPIYFYSIPGNHDYYSWGLPFLCFVKEINSEEFAKQQASYFCLRSEDGRWQFLGADSAYHDSNPLDQMNQINSGPRLRSRELAWHKHKMQQFQGSTIFLTHHQLFSIHDRLCGSLSRYRHFSCLNPLLSQQLFEYMPYFSGWWWGHEHAFMLFKQNFWGVPLCRLLGNSSFHVWFEKQHPYRRKQGFPPVPFIKKDKEYLKEYLPLNPSNQKENYFNLCYALIDLEKAGDDLHVEYMCSPSYNDKQKKKRHFKRFLLYQESIPSRKKLLNQARSISIKQYYYFKCQIGLLLDEVQGKLKLNMKGTSLHIEKCQKDKENIQDQDKIIIHLGNHNKKFGFLGSNGKEVTLGEQPTQWKIGKKYVMKDTQFGITTLNVFYLKQTQTKLFLGWQIGNLQNHLILSEREYLWMFLTEQSVIRAEQL